MGRTPGRLAWCLSAALVLVGCDYNWSIWQDDGGGEGPFDERGAEDGPLDEGGAGDGDDGSPDEPEEADAGDDGSPDDLEAGEGDQDASVDEPEGEDGEDDGPLDEFEAGDEAAEVEAEVGPVCGDGTPEGDEECDDGNGTDGDGCDSDCTWSCHDAAECDDDLDCTNDACDLGTHTCGHGLLADRCLIDGACRAAGDENPADSCEACVPAAGAESWTRKAAGDPCDDGDECTADEACDAGGACGGGTNVCECVGTADCAAHEDGNPCNGTLICDATHRCVVDPATVRAAGSSCDDGLWCDGTDSCDAAHDCVHSGSPCGAACQTCDELFDRCDVAEGYCYILAACYAEGDDNPLDSCKECASSASRTSWTDKAEGASCDDGQWCNGEDTCSAAHACTHAGSPCPSAVCVSCDEAGDRCEVGTGSCFADGACRSDGATNPANECQTCQAAVEPLGWSAKPDFTPCTLVTSPDYSYDICSSGACVSPGTCGDASCNAPGLSFPLPDTNQRLCFDLATTIACPGTPGAAECGSTPFCGQDAQYGWDTVHPATDRFTRTEPVSGEPIVTDNVTTLVWQGCVAGLSGTSCTVGTSAGYAWTDALGYCDALAWGGFDDWRLPSPREAQSIVDNSRTTVPLLDPSAFPGSPAGFYWTSSVSSSLAGQAWGLYGSGGLNERVETDMMRVRCVRAGPASGVPAPRFSRTLPAPAHPVVSDRATGLMWQGCQAGLSGEACDVGAVVGMTWQEALAYCEALNWGGQIDWRLATAMEIGTLVDDRRRDPALDAAAFPATDLSSSWSATSYGGAASTALMLSLDDGHVFNSTLPEYAKDQNWTLRCVRGAP